MAQARTRPLYHDKARRLARRYNSPRYAAIDALESVADGSIYDGRPGWFDSARDVPLLERRPCVIYPSVKIAAQIAADFVLGEGRWPAITSFTTEDGKVFDRRFGLSEEESAIVDALIASIEEQASLQAACNELLVSAQVSKTAVAVLGISDGKLCVEPIKAKWCTPTFVDGRKNEVASIVIEYAYVETYRDASTAFQYAERAMLYRREIDGVRDVTFVPAIAPDDVTQEPAWVPDKSRTFEHGLGFCPVVWYPFRPKTGTVVDIDGCAIHEGHEEMADALNVALSQKHRAALYSGDPQMVVYGVAKSEDLSPPGRSLSPRVNPNNGYAPETYGLTPRQGGNVQRRGAGVVWRIEGEYGKCKAELLTLPAGALESLERDAEDLKVKLSEALSVVLPDIQHMRVGSEFSAKAMRTLYQRMIASCDKIRDDFGKNCVLKIVDMFLRIVLRAETTQPGRIYLSSAEEAAPVLARFLQLLAPTGEDGARDSRWFSPRIGLQWGRYFDADPSEERSIVDTAATARGAGLIEDIKAIEKIADIFGIDNPSAYCESLHEAREGERHEQLEIAHALNGAANANGQRRGTDEESAIESDARGEQGQAQTRDSSRAHAPMAQAEED